jgi:hypothetical protein
MKLEDFTPNLHARGFWAGAYIYTYTFLVLGYAYTIRLPRTLRENRQWKRDKEIDSRWGAAVYAAQRTIEDEVYARTGSRAMTGEDCERYNNARKHIRREDFIDPPRPF